jgi:hypothetical protein
MHQFQEIFFLGGGRGVIVYIVLQYVQARVSLSRIGFFFFLSVVLQILCACVCVSISFLLRFNMETDLMWMDT